MKKHQLKSLVKAVVLEMIAHKDAKPDVFGAVNVEAVGLPKAKGDGWEEIDHGFFRINSDLARRLAGGKLPEPGYEKLVKAPPGFAAKHGFVWLAQTVVGGNPTWSMRDAKGWRLVNGQAILSSDAIDEMTATGAVAGYATPFAFSKSKEGSGRAIKAAKKYGKVVKSISEEQK